MDEIFYYDGHWYMAKAPEFVLPPFDFDRPPLGSMLRDWRWSMTIAPPPLPMCIVTGV